MEYTITLDGKIVVITGGYGYLGKAITLGLLANGAIVYVLGLDAQKFKREFIDNDYVDSLFFEYCDVSSSDSIKTAFGNIGKTNVIDVLINNAFYSKGQSPESMVDEDWSYGIEGTLNSCFKCIREIVPYLKNSGRGKIINVSSMYGVVAPQFEIYNEYPQFLNPPHYGAAKAGVIQLTKYYAAYLGKIGINVNAVTPGPFPSSSVQSEGGFVDSLAERTCLNRIGKPEDLVGAFVFLSSDASNYITGHNLVVDGGWTIK